MKKRFVSLLAVFCLIIGLIPSYTVYATGSADDLIARAEAELGTKETGNNIVKYWDSTTNSSLQGNSWCAAFIVWCARKVNIGADVIPSYYSCYAAGDSSQRGFFLKQGRYTYRANANPQRGDLVIFEWGHIGIVTSVDSSKIYTIEGNTSNDMVERKSYSKSYSQINGYCRPAYGASNKPTNVSLERNQNWYDIQDTITLTPKSNGATSYYMSICNSKTNKPVIQTGLSGAYSVAASKLGYGDYYAWISATNSSGTTDSATINFSVVGAATHTDVNVNKKIFTTGETVSISVSPVCAKGVVIGIDKDGTGRVVTQTCDTTYSIAASKLGVGNYSAYFSVWNGSGGVDTKQVSFSIVNPVNLGNDFYAFIINTSSWKMISNDNRNVSLRSEIPADKQKWHFIRQSDNSYKIYSMIDGNCLDVYNGSADSQANVQVYNDNSSDAQRWYIYGSDKEYRLSAKCTNCVLDLNGGYTTDGTNVQMYINNNTNAQKYTIYRIDDKAPTYSKLSTNKTSYTAGENVTFALRSDYATSFNITVSKNGTTVWSSNVKSDVTKSFADPGNYTAVMTAKNAKASVKSNTVSFTVIKNVTGVSLNKASTTIEVGKSETLTATVTPSNATNKNVTWSSTNTNVADVSNGVVTGKAAGTATITVKTADGSKTASCTVTVKTPIVAVTGVNLNKTSTTIEVGNSETLTATVTPSNATNKNVTWSSTNTNVATVSNGVVTGKAAGTATIMVKTADGSKTASCTVTVKTPTVAVTGVSLNKTSTTIEVGKSETLTATVTPSNATNKNVTWSSSNTNVATVSNGVVTGKSAGVTTIIVETADGTKTAACNVTVTSSELYIVETGKCGDNVTWSYRSDGLFTIGGTGEMYDYYMKTPDWAKYYDSIKKIKVEGGVSKVGWSSFDYFNNTVNSKVEEIEVEEGVVELEEGAFKHCPNVKKIILPSTLKKTGLSVFDCTPEELYIADLQKWIDIDFAKTGAEPDSGSSPLFIIDCDKLKVYVNGKFTENLVIPDGVTSIPSEKFYNWSCIKSVTIPKSVTRIERCAFESYSEFIDVNKLTDIYYEGTESEWAAIKIDETNDTLKNATIHFTESDDKTDYTGTISLPNTIVGEKGKTVSIPVSINDNPGIAGFNLEVKYDKSIMTPVSIEKGSVFSGGTLNSNISQGGDLSRLDYVTAYWSNPSNVTSDGEMFIIKFMLNKSADEGEYPVTISYNKGDITNQALDDVMVNVVNGSVKVSNVMKGDIYQDGIVNTKDGVILSQYLAKWNVNFTDKQMKAADVYEDGIVNTKDGVKLSQVLAKWNNVTLSDDVELNRNDMEVMVQAVNAKPGDYVEVPVIVLSNPGIAGFNFSVEYDKNALTPVSISAGDILKNGSFTSNVQQGGDLSKLDYVTAYWNAPSDMKDNGTLFTIKFKVSEEADGDIPVSLSYNDGDICNQNLDNVNVNIVDGMVAVKTINYEKYYDIESTEIKSQSGDLLNEIPSDGDFMIDVSLNKIEEYNEAAAIRAAVYNSEGRMISVTSADITNDESYILYVPKTDEDISVVRLYIWSLEDKILPIADITEIQN